MKLDSDSQRRFKLSHKYDIFSGFISPTFLHDITKPSKALSLEMQQYIPNYANVIKNICIFLPKSVHVLTNDMAGFFLPCFPIGFKI